MMGEEFYAILKLVSGEEIFSLIIVDNTEEDDTVIVLQNPVIMWTISNPNGTFIKVKPWMELPDEDIFMIRLDKVITMTETDDKKLIKLYNHYISGDELVYDINGLTKPDSDMGYISSVEDARKNLEKTFKLNQES
tara:strand:+ start:177 stop:584 length:408 start_codon:yes stop_codon:yes gene_type:complete